MKLPDIAPLFDAGTDVITVGSLFSGYEGFGLGLSAAGIEHRHLWVADNNPAASKVLAARLPGVPNLGDITKVDWRTLAVPDLLTGGFPCQDVSLAGRRAGLSADTRSGLWLVMAEAIRVMRPRWVLIENTRGLLSAKAHSDVEPCPWCLGDRGGDDQEPVLRALGAVLGDLSDLGYDTRWVTVGADDVGAAHERKRVFVLAHRPGDEPTEEIFAPAARSRWGGGVDSLLSPLLPTLRASDTGTEGRRASEGFRPPLSQVVFDLMPTARTSDTNGAGLHGSGGLDLRTAVTLLPTPDATHGRKTTRTGPLLAGIEALLPTPAACRSGRQKSTSPGAAIRPSLDQIDKLLPTARATDATKAGPNQRGSKGDLMLPSAVASLLPTACATDAKGARNATANRRAPKPTTQTDRWTLSDVCFADMWGKYAPAIARWEQIVGRPAPEPMVIGDRGGRVLSPYFDEWFMGLPEGWLTDLLRRTEVVAACGNGLMPQQLAYGLARLGEVAP